MTGRLVPTEPRPRGSGVFRCALLLALLCVTAAAQQKEMSDAEQEHLRQVLSAGSSSAVDLIAALESHLAKYPDSPKKDDIERAIVKSAIQAKDYHRIAIHGVRVLGEDPDNPPTLDAVCRALLLERTEAQSREALKWAKHFETYLRALTKEMPPDTPERGRRRDELEKLLGRALNYQAMATGQLGDNQAAAELARASFAAYPAGEAALEVGRRLALAGKQEEAIRWYADAFTIADPQASESDRAAIRRRMGELHQKLKGSETGLGDIVLRSYDRMSALLAERRLALKQYDPNTGAENPLDFTLSGVNGDRLPLSTLAGKVVILDFWATWCGPCRAQHPLYEDVKKRFKNDPLVVFLSINTDEERSMVKPFLAAQGWKNAVYFEDGLSRVLRVSSIPTTVVFGKNGTVVSRMNGYNPENFADTLTERIRAALGTGANKEGQ
jgi:thiol-disulfide isomerase/thioredoxin